MKRKSCGGGLASSRGISAGEEEKEEEEEEGERDLGQGERGSKVPGGRGGGALVAYYVLEFTTLATLRYCRIFLVIHV